MIAQANWEVITPSSVDESAPQLTSSRPHLNSTQSQTGPAMAGTTAAYGAEETALSAAELRSAQARARRAGMANPQTPWSPSESGANNYAQDMQAYRQHVASLEQARTVAAASYAPLIAIAEAPPPAQETPVASADAVATPIETAGNTAAAAQRTDIPPANTPVANAEANADIDRLLRNQEGPQDRPRETVATMSPMLVDTRQPASSDLRVESTGSEPPTGTAAGAGMQQPDAATQVGGTADAAAIASVAGSSGSVGQGSASEGGTVSAVELPPAPQATSTAPEAAPASAQASASTSGQ
jgi:hypothetical protein